MKKRLFFLMMCLFILTTSFSAFAQEEPLQIVAANFPAFDLARTLTASSADVALLLPPGSESHSYEPTPQDMIAIQHADLFIYTGGESDHWIEEILSAMGSDAPRTFRMADSVVLLEEEYTHSMEHDHHHDESCDHEHEQEMDEHVWTSPRNVMAICLDLKSLLCEMVPQNAAMYEETYTAYIHDLQMLDAAFCDVVKNARRDLLVFGDRFPLRYFAHAYGLRYDAAFPGCSEDSEPSVRTVISLIDTVREQKIPVICYIEFSSRRTADILAEETGAKPMLFHSCHNVSADEIAHGATYLSLMLNNVEVLKEALN